MANFIYALAVLFAVASFSDCVKDQKGSKVPPRIPGRCLEPVFAGPCKQNTTMYFYNEETKKCGEFKYGGCKGNHNKFPTLEKCESVCIPKDTSDKPKEPIDKPIEPSDKPKEEDNEKTPAEEPKT